MSKSKNKLELRKTKIMNLNNMDSIKGGNFTNLPSNTTGYTNTANTLPTNHTVTGATYTVYPPYFDNY